MQHRTAGAHGEAVSTQTAPNVQKAPQQAAVVDVKKSPQAAPGRAQKPFTAPTDSSRDYRSMYGEIFRFHQRHNPPLLEADDSAAYWAEVAHDQIRLSQQFGDDAYMITLLTAVVDELEAQYKAMRAAGLEQQEPMAEG